MTQYSEKTYYMYLSPTGDVWSLTPAYEHLQYTSDMIQCNMATQFKETEGPALFQSFDGTYHQYLKVPLETFYRKQASMYGQLVHCYVHSKLNNPEGMQRIVNYFENIYKKVPRSTEVNSNTSLFDL
jgi:hypothetical protein